MDLFAHNQQNNTWRAATSTYNEYTMYIGTIYCPYGLITVLLYPSLIVYKSYPYPLIPTAIIFYDLLFSLLHATYCHNVQLVERGSLDEEEYTNMW